MGGVVALAVFETRDGRVSHCKGSLGRQKQSSKQVQQNGIPHRKPDESQGRSREMLGRMREGETTPRLWFI